MEKKNASIAVKSTSSTNHQTSTQVLGAQTKLTHGGDDLNDCDLSLCEPLLMLALTFSGQPALLFTIIGLGEGRTYLAHQLTKALLTHRYIGKAVIR